MPSKPVVIVGAGVLGLTTAAVLQDRYPRLRITIVAAEVPLTPPFTEAPRPSPDYASMWAGAHFRPDGGSAEEHELALYTARVMKTIALRSPESGVQSVIGREITERVPENKSHFKSGDVYALDKGEGEFHVLGSQELNPGGAWGCEYQTWIVNVHIYCRWLLTRFVRQGGNLVQRRLASLDEAFEVLEHESSCPPLVINCSGRNFDTDPRCNVIRGQTILVKNTYHKTATRHNKDDSWSFLIPRPLGGGTIVGGTKQMGDWGTEIRPQETKAILEAAVKYWPDFVSKVDDFEVLAINVGRRPWRDGGLRIERETLGQDKVVVHGYGAGARGYELSWGAAERIVGLVGREMGERAKL
ncbi:D-amino-acid oxidase [Fusarium albosuccineum]|uniref:D-amino-acid oxidase n=1 Tax=Fusarium albosuccineum TaxID=1237068 RepID=A0A8H4P6T4_9HYPO|nr:D-amino-acid oxidase [Fusarium albosuccineum]